MGSIRRWALPTGFTGLLLVLAVWHFLIDTVACLLQPLWPTLESQFELHNGRIFGVYLLWSMTTSFGQLVVGCFADRFRSRWLLWATPFVAVVCLGLLGSTSSPWVLSGLLFIGALAIAAFHPEAAATAGTCFPEHRSRAMSVFALAGYLGQSAGPFYSGWVTSNGGLPALAKTIPWGLAAAAVVGLAACFVAWPRPSETPRKESRAGVSRSFPSVLLLIAIGMTRVLPALGVPLAIAFLMDARGETTAAIGLVQSAFMFGIGAGSLACATALRRDHERMALWAFPLFAAPCVLAMRFAQQWAGLASVLAGFCIGITLPVLISYGQRLLPKSQRMASSLTMGVTWGIASGILAGTMAVLKSWDRVEWSLPLFASALVVSAVLSALLPQLRD